MTEKGSVVLYIDRASVAFAALVVGVNNLNQDVLDVAYFDPKTDALKTEFGVPHMSDESRKETNPDLPQYTLNCWKDYDEEHLALPRDHPAHDHPFQLKKLDGSGRIVTKERPEFEKHVVEHQAANAPVPDAGGIPIPPAVDSDSLPTGIGYSNVLQSGGLTPAVSATEVQNSAPVVEPAPEAEKEPDVIAQLDAAGPAPVAEEEKKPEDAA